MSRRHNTILALPIDVLFLFLLGLAKLTKALKSHKFSPKLKKVDQMSGLEFERFVAKILKSQGYKSVKLTVKYDYGIDIIADKDNERWGIQVKRYKGLVKANAVRQTVTALKKYGCTRAMVISNSNFSNYATELARCNDCVLIDRSKLAQWISR